MSDSGGPYSDLDPASLRELRDEYKELVRTCPTGHPDDRDERRSWSQELSRRITVLNEAKEEIAYRSAEKERKREERERRQIERDDQRRRRAEERAAQFEKDRTRQPTGPPEETLLDRASLTLGDQALGRYLDTLGVDELPKVRTENLKLSWKALGCYFLAFFAPHGTRLDVWIRVQPGTTGARVIGKQNYLPANNADEVARARPNAVLLEGERRREQDR